MTKSAVSRNVVYAAISSWTVASWMTRAVAARHDALADFGSRDVPDVHARVRLGSVAQLAVGRNQRCSLDLGTGEIETVVDRMVDLEGNGRGMGDKVRGWVQRDGIG